ncbi:hypothetical protein MNBD_NITROSPIRAE02-1311 [hydrothermal vent metagenome]|uniref:Uncharacterized protein n=1 Tax=hydrothermal vent metagenome TaxID=652676 RepID=A0A3B1CRS3_9ZZZZ
MNIRNEKGNIKPVLCIILLIVSVYIGYKFTLPYYRYFTLKSETRAIARLSYNKPDRYRDLVYAEARALDIPVTPSDIYVVVTDRQVRISTSWSEVVDLAGYYQVPLDFEVDVEE